MINITETISLAEILVVTMAILGLLAAAYNIWGALKDGRIQRKSGINGYKKRLVKWSIREETLRSLMLIGFGTAGVISMTIPPRPDIPNQLAGQSIQWLILLVELAITYGSICAAIDRVLIQSDWAKEAIKVKALAERLKSAEATVAGLDTQWDKAGRRGTFCDKCGHVMEEAETEPLIDMDMDDPADQYGEPSSGL